MIIVGGLYQERCVVPEWNQLFGSGGRAAIALATLAPDIRLHCFVADDFKPRAQMAMAACGVELVAAPGPALLVFSYFHPSSRASWFDSGRAATALDIRGDLVLRFGMIEGEALVTTDTAVYDPQFEPVRFRDNGSTARRVATVLNEEEARGLGATDDPIAGAMAVLADGPEDVVVLKRGASGALVFTHSASPQHIPAYRASTIFKIGSGDVFSAAFALHWGSEGRRAAEAADLASRAVAHYVNCRTLPLPKDAAYLHGPAAPIGKLGMVYLAGPFFTLGQRWLIEEALRTLRGLGCPVFSPLHEVGFGDPQTVTPADLAGLDGSTAVLALLDGGDPGTLFEVGHARSRGIPVVGLAEDVLGRDLTMPLGSGCDIVSDLTTAAYRTAWASMR